MVLKIWMWWFQCGRNWVSVYKRGRMSNSKSTCRSITCSTRNNQQTCTLMERSTKKITGQNERDLCIHLCKMVEIICHWGVSIRTKGYPLKLFDSKLPEIVIFNIVQGVHRNSLYIHSESDEIKNLLNFFWKSLFEKNLEIFFKLLCFLKSSLLIKWPSVFSFTFGTGSNFRNP